MRIFKRILSSIIILVLMAGALPFAPILPVTLTEAYAYSGEDAWYIRSNYTSGAYLYEADGVLRYGLPIAPDPRFQWLVENQGENKVIKNAATGHCITLQGHDDETVEGYWGDQVECLDFQEGNDTFLWSLTPGKGQNILSASIKYAQFALHLENADNGQALSQKLPGDQLNWGNMKWDFVKEKDINFSSAIRDGFCIQNAENGQYLRAQDGFLAYGTPNQPDDTYIWTFEQQPDGSKAIKNKGTGEYIAGRKDNGTHSLFLTDFAANDEFLWDFQVSRETPILWAGSNSKGSGLFLDGAGRISIGEIKSKWNIIRSVEVEGVVGPLVLEEGIYQLKNSWFSLVMLDDDGVPVYGNAQPSDPNSHWRILFDKASGLTALQNVGSGRYLQMNSSQQLVLAPNECYYWRLNRNTNAAYPDAVQFQDSMDTKRYLHMESLSGRLENSNAVQPSWGTPHWEPIKVDGIGGISEEPSNFEAPAGYIRLQSLSNPGEYLYENASGALLYGDIKPDDARGHWEVIKSANHNGYLLKNREYENYVTHPGNGTLRLIPEEGIVDGSLWQLARGDGEGTLLLISADPKLKPYLRPYLHIKKQSGSAQCTLVAAEEPSAQWVYEAAPEAVTPVDSAEEVKVPVNFFPDTNLYKLTHNGQPLSGTYRLEYMGTKVRVIDTKSHQYLYDDAGLKTKRLEKQKDPSVQWELIEKAGVTELKRDKTRIILEKISSDAVYEAKSAHVLNSERIFTVYAHETKEYKVGIDYKGSRISCVIKVNGIPMTEVKLPIKEKTLLSLNKGINTIALPDSEGLTGITLIDSIHKSYRGASASYISYEAEDLNNTGTLIDEDRTYRTLSSEASGRLAVRLDGTGQNIKLTLVKPANALVIRYAIPDSSDGNGLNATLNLYIDGQKLKGVDLTSRYSWVYGAYPWTNHPVDGQAHHFYDEVRVRLDKTYPAGTVIKLQKDSDNQAEYYIVDTIETEEVDQPHKQPENSLSVLDFGAIPNDGKDDTGAILSCIEEAARLGREVWLPEGVFNVDTPAQGVQEMKRGIVLSEDHITLRGAGMWHTILKGEYAAFFIKANDIALYDFTLSGAAVSRRDSIDPSAIETDYDTPKMRNIILQNLWIEHYKTGIWTHNLEGLHVVGCRIRNTFADGINLRRGTSNSVVEQCDIRNTGDDAIALWSSDYSNTDNRIRFNTVSLPWLANNIALYGGTDIAVTDNILRDTVGMGGGVNISSNFDPKPFAGTIEVARNTLIRCGSFNANYNMDSGAIWFNTVAGNDNHANVLVKENIILDSTFQGIFFMNKGKVDQVVLEGNMIDGGTVGIDITAGARGAATARNNIIRNVMIKDIQNGSADQFSLTIEYTEAVNQVLLNKKAPVVVYAVAILALLVLAASMMLLKARKKVPAGTSGGGKKNA